MDILKLKSLNILTRKLTQFKDALTTTSSTSSSDPICWRQTEVKQIFLDGDREQVSRLLRFRLFDEEFAALMKIDLSSLTRDDVHFDPGRIWKLSDFKDAEPDKIAYYLAGESLHQFLRVPFDDWVRKALGILSQSVHSFEFLYEFLSATLYYHLRRNLNRLEIFLDVRCVRIQSKRFPGNAC